MSASLTDDKKKEILLKAFDAGYPVWIDEINSCINTGLEKTLNSLLTGKHPITGLPAAKPGFFLLGSTNSAGLAGRSILSPALKDRSAYIDMTLTEKDIQCIIVDTTKKLAKKERAHTALTSTSPHTLLGNNGKDKNQGKTADSNTLKSPKQLD